MIEIFPHILIFKTLIGIICCYVQVLIVRGTFSQFLTVYLKQFKSNLTFSLYRNEILAKQKNVSVE